MIKKVVIAFCSWMIVLTAYSQGRMPGRVNTYTDGDDETGFKKQNLFVGGGLGLGFGPYNFEVGVSPEIGYSVTRWLDVGALVNFSYNSERADPNYYYNPDIGSKQFVYGGGVFGRAWVLPWLFLTAQPEFNWTSVTQTAEPSGLKLSYNANAPSLLLGAGLGHRLVGSSTAFFAIMFDAISNSNSPYNDAFGHPLPVIKAGIDFYIHGNR